MKYISFPLNFEKKKTIKNLRLKRNYYLLLSIILFFSKASIYKMILVWCLTLEHLTECEKPPAIQNGYSTHDEKVVVENEKVQYRCNEGFTMSDQSTSLFTCTNGKYLPKITESAIKCKKSKYR